MRSSANCYRGEDKRDSCCAALVSIEGIPCCMDRATFLAMRVQTVYADNELKSLSANADNLCAVVYCFPPRNNTLSTPQKFFPLQITAERWKIFFRGGKAFSTFRRLQRSDQPQENFPLSSFLEICELSNLSMKSNSAAQKLSVTQRQR
jgi:hypothetical protein